MLQPWRRQARASAMALSSTDGRWALVSTSITAVIAGTITWVAAGAAAPTNYDTSRSRLLMPYELFQHLSPGGRGPDYAVVSPFAPFAAQSEAHAPPQPLLNASLSTDSDSAEIPSAPANDVREATLERGDALPNLLLEAGATPQDAIAALRALARTYNLRNIRAGQSFELTFAPPPPKAVAEIIYTPPNAAAAAMDTAQTEAGAGRLLSITFSPTIEHDVTVSRVSDGSFTAQDEFQKLAAHFHRAGARIDSSLYLAAMQAGIPARVVVQMIHMFSYEVDFQRDIRPGDSFEVYYNYYYTPDGEPAKEGEIAYAAMHFADRTVALYRYQPKGEDTADFFDAQGQSAKSMLMKTPVDGARISSGFGMRFHPVLGYSRMHKGVDFAVPSGTPVMAAGAGTIQVETRENGYGNFVLLNHGNGYETAYAHLSRFAPGVRRGSHVRQGQVIAYSGATGLATGPHLHYEVRIHNVQVNPTTVKVAGGRILFGSDLRDFQIARMQIDSQLAALPMEGKIADTAADLRSGKD
ncbi:MAG TPA: M23 family metallopeptidase [Rhizomicrobium sp.]|jgi:murein DD-endopeptidase MepM/ murein hydrolase activator NlpD|nr:M23 family metallopeptidase [Rhizomicrobium sp.]